MSTLRQLLRDARAHRDQERLITDAEHTIKQHLHRAQKRGLAATLTVAQWQTTVAYFQNKCAYCQEKHCEVLEHFIPIELGGGTTADNCVPACRRCNSAKGPWHPSQIPFSTPNSQRIRQSIARVQHYLKTCGSEVGA